MSLLFFVFILCFFFFFKQKTAYEMRISDWSSDVCSSDLTGTTRQEGEALRAAVAVATDRPISHVVATHVHFDHCFGHCAFSDLPVRFVGHRNLPRALAERAEFYTKLDRKSVV